MRRVAFFRSACFLVLVSMLSARSLARAAEADPQAAAEHHPAAPALTPAQALERLMEGNVQGQLVDTPLLKERIAKNQLQVKAAVYELGTGRVRLLE